MEVLEPLELPMARLEPPAVVGSLLLRLGGRLQVVRPS